MNTKYKLVVALILFLTATGLSAQSSKLKIATISAGAARLDNGSLVNIGQPLVGNFGSPQDGVVGSAGIVGALRRATAPPQSPMFNSPTWSTNGGLRLSFQAAPGWTYGVEASTNLVDWIALWLTNALEATIIYEDMDSLQYDRRFYRVTTY